MSCCYVFLCVKMYQIFQFCCLFFGMVSILFFFTSTKQAIYFLFLQSFCFYFVNLYWVDLFEYICIYSLKVTLGVYQKELFYQKRSLGSQTVILRTIILVYDRGIERYLWQTQIGESYVTLYLIYLCSLWRFFYFFYFA